MREVNLNLWIILTNSVITATEKSTTRARVFKFMGSQNGGGIVPGVDLGLLVAEQHKGEEQAVLVLYPKKR
jgi:hypothetical protein